MLLLNENISLDIYGDGPLKEELNKTIANLSASSYIKINDFSFNLATEFEKHNTFVLSSKFEGFPNTLAEAMMSGLACLSTPCPTGPKEMIENRKNGILFNDSDELCAHLLELASNANRCQELGKNARETAKSNFEDVVVLPRYLKNISE